MITTAVGRGTVRPGRGRRRARVRHRQLLAPGLRPQPAPYRVWRGAIPLDALSGRPRELELLRGAWVTLGYPGGHGVFYLIPGGPQDGDGSGGAGNRPLA
ncbi:hypothetical protein [Streptomyces sp. TRM75563]|uniref:hypothetical protein n=1 Tax=Streptomyces sp. TRM75563 TaxID=2817418 RepID=UPI001F61DD62|nr:hypothetical protein [Streptomyces sp. TRM75563]MCI4046200.1 hypothetical protein [Streptomyces sp. TRM75563]